MSIKKTEIIKLIKMKCLECCCQDVAEVKACTVITCPLYSLRLGSKGVEAVEVEVVPKRKRAPMSDEHKLAMKNGRDKKKLINN